MKKLVWFNHVWWWKILVTKSTNIYSMLLRWGASLILDVKIHQLEGFLQIYKIKDNMLWWRPKSRGLLLGLIHNLTLWSSLSDLFLDCWLLVTKFCLSAGRPHDENNSVDKLKISLRVWKRKNSLRVLMHGVRVMRQQAMHAQVPENTNFWLTMKYC